VTRTHQTTACAKYDHPEFVIACEESVVPAPDVEWLVDYLERSVASGERYRPEETIRIGWTDVLLEGNQGRLQLLEPDWTGALPYEHVPSVTKTLVHLRRQKDVADSLDLLDRLSFPSIRHSALICDRLFGDAIGVMDRVEPEAADSGWFIGCTDASHDHNEAETLRRTSLYEIACSLPASAQFCALPAGTKILFIRDGGVRVTLDGEPLSIKEDSYLRQLILRRVH
jgi:hypothetical protein